jgi:arylsulfate sulfotransferase
MELQFLQTARRGIAASLLLVLAACGGGGSQAPAPIATQVEAAVQTSNQAVFAAGGAVAGVTPFIAFVTLRGTAIKNVASVNFVIAAAPGTVSKPVSVTYSLANLVRRAYVDTSANTLTVPIFGLYAGGANAVTINLTFNDASTFALPTSISTAPWVDPNETYDRPTIVKARATGDGLGFDFLYMKSIYGSPVVIDTDGHVRWVGPGITQTLSTDYADGGFVMASDTSPDLYRVDLDGTWSSTANFASSGVTTFFHDIEAGKTGFLGNVDGNIGGVFQMESTALEFQPDGTVVGTWDLAKAISDVMTAGGDDPTLFVRPGTDWFHMNTAIYDAADDSVIVSSRENFVVKLDYATGAIRWIMGDPSKYWYTFASLRAKALTWVGDGLVPIGQHSVTIAHDGSLMLFNNGYGSLNQPAGAPAGDSRAYSAVSDYRIDEAAGTVQQAWSFDYAQSISSIICSSARDTSDGSVLVNYAVAENLTAARVVGLDATHAVAFDFRFANASGCNTSWNAQPLALDALSLD